LNGPPVRSAVVVAHKFLTQPDDELVLHLNALGIERLLHICHSFSDAPDRRSYYRLYERGVKVREHHGRDWRRWPEPFIYAKELVDTVFWATRRGGPWELYVGMDGLCVLFGNVLRALGRVRRTVFWAIDYVPAQRFGSRLKNAIYAAVNRASYRGADSVWDLSPRMAQARERFGGIAPGKGRSVVVPYGAWLDRIPFHPHAQCDPNTIVFMGHLLEKQGVQLAIRALPLVLERFPQARLLVLGGGHYRDALEALARELGVAHRCEFTGRVEDVREIERRIARCAVAVAPYVRALDTWTLYADPGKVKTYLACGVPVLLTDVPWNTRLIVEAGCGMVISEDPADIADKAVRALDPATNQSMRENARRFAREFEWPRIFDAALRRECGTGEVNEGR
jgi:glycosyltransferase involved in cell wall biosynthesis